MYITAATYKYINNAFDPYHTVTLLFNQGIVFVQALVNLITFSLQLIKYLFTRNEINLIIS